MAFDPILDFIVTQGGTEDAPLSAGAQQELTQTGQLIENRVGQLRAANVNFAPPVETPGFLSDLGTGILDSGIAVGIGEIGAQATAKVFDGITNDLDPDFSFAAATQDPNVQSRIDNILKLQETSAAARFAALSLVDARNLGYVNFILDRYDEAVLRRKEVEDSGLTGYVLGAGASIALDILVAGLMTRGAASAPAAARGLGALTMNITARGAVSQRLIAAGRIGALGAVEGSVERVVQQMGDENITDNEIWLAMGLGAGAGGLLGAFVPRTLGRVFTRENVNAIELEQAKMVARRQASEEFKLEAELDAPEPKAGGAQATPDADDVLTPSLPGKGSGTLVSKHIHMAVRNPRNWIRDMGVRGAALLKSHGLEGNLHMWRFGQRLYKSAVNTEGEIAGTEVRSLTFSEAIRGMDDELRVQEFNVKATYRAMLQDVYDQGKFKAWVGNDQLMKLVLPGKIGRKFVGGALRQEEFNWHADIFAQARGDDLKAGTPNVNSERAIESIKANLELSPEQATKYIDHLKKLADQDDEFYMGWAKRGQKEGLIGVDEPIRLGYRPQMWHRRQIMENKAVFQTYMYTLFGNKATPEFVNEFFERPSREFAGEVFDEANPFVAQKKVIDIEAGETFDDWAKKNPELAVEVQAQWADNAAVKTQEKLDELAITRDEVFKQAATDSLATFEARAAASKVKYTKRLDKKNQQFLEADPADTDVINKLSTDIGKIELELGKIETRLDLVRQADGDFEAIAALIRKRGSRVEKKLVGKAAKLAAKAENKAMRAFVNRSMDDAVQEVTDKLTDAKSAFGLVPDELISGSRHFKHRTIDLGELREDPAFAKFLVRDSGHQRNAYIGNYGRQTLMREIFAPVLRRAGLHKTGDKVGEFLPKLKKFSLREFEEDTGRIAKLDVDDKTRKALSKESNDERIRADHFFDRSFGEITRSDYLNQTGDLGHALATVQAATAATMLGNVFASLLGDVAITAFAGGRFGTGLAGMIRTRTYRRILKEIGDDDVDTMLLLRGANVYDQGLFMSRADLDNPAFDVPGGKWSTVNKFATDIATKEGWFNLMHQWNRFIRGTFGMDFAKQVSKDMGDFGNLDETMVRFYAKHGVGTQQAKELASALESHGRKFMDGRLVVPDSKVWMDAGLSKELKTYQRLVRSAGDEAMVDPQIGDRPFLRRFAAGRLALQFQSFTFSAGERFYAPMWQSLAMNPADMRVHGSLMLGMMLATTGEALRAHRRGELDSWMDEFGTNQGRFDKFKAAWIRSPFIYGMTGTALDIVGTETAPLVNRAFTAATGSKFKPSDDRYSKLRQRQGPLGFIPALGTGSTAFQAVREAMDGDTQALMKMGKHRVPGWNALIFHTGAQLLNDIE